MKRMSNDDPENMSRAEIAEVVRSGQLTENEYRKYVTTYQEKLARPFACFVFILIAIPFGLRSIRSGASTSLGFGLSLAIVFVYYVVMTVCSFAAETVVGLAALWAWVPNISLYGDRFEPVAACGTDMNFIEIMRGIGNLAAVMALAGAVAYVGDRVGHQVGAAG